MVAQEIPALMVLTKRSPRYNQISYQQYQRIKRLFDLTVCMAILPFILVVFALIAVAICLDSPGSPFFLQERVGKGRRRFIVYKFRSMWQNYDDNHDRTFMKAYVMGQISMGENRDGKVARFKPIHEKDVTRVGKFLRKTSLDELPQIINVLRGEMSLIGPRPNVLWEVDAYMPWHYERLDTLPGITGLAQVMGRSDISFDQIARYDIDYSRHQNLKLDFWILRQTFHSVISRSGAG